MKAHGYPDYQLRATVHEAEERSAVPLVSAHLQPVSGAFALEEQSATELTALDEDFAWRGSGAWIGASSSLSSGKCLLHSPFWLPKQWMLALHHRKGPLFLNEGYPIKMDEQFEIRLPDGSQIDTCPRVRKNEQGPLRWQSEWATVGNGKLRARLQVELLQGELSPGDTPKFQKQVRELLASLADDAILSVSP
jgi:hypothetical protein